MLVAHKLLILVSCTRILLHKQQMTLRELVTALPRDWPQLQSLTLTFLQSASNMVQLGYSQMRQTRLVTALFVAPPAWVAWSIAVIGEIYESWTRCSPECRLPAAKQLLLSLQDETVPICHTHFSTTVSFALESL